MNNIDYIIALDIAKNSGITIYKTSNKSLVTKEFTFEDLYVYIKKIIFGQRIYILFYDDLGGAFVGNAKTTRKLGMYKGEILALCKEYSLKYYFSFYNETKVFCSIFKKKLKRAEKKISAITLYKSTFNSKIGSDGAESYVLFLYYQKTYL